MKRIGLALVGAVAMSGAGRAQDPAPVPGVDPALAQAFASAVAPLSGTTMEISRRGKTIAVTGRFIVESDACRPTFLARPVGKTKDWKRPINLGRLAWTGEEPGGRTRIALFDPETHDPGDVIALAPGDHAPLRAALRQLAAACMAHSPSGETVLVGAPGPVTSCYFRRVPGLVLTEWPKAPTEPRRAWLTMMSNETMAGELNVLFEQDAPAPGARVTGLGKPSVTFAYANPRYATMGISDAAFALDGRPVAPRFTLAAYGDNRARVTVSSMPGAGDFFGGLVRSKTATMRLLDGTKDAKVALGYDLGVTFALTREELEAVNWSCAGAVKPRPISQDWAEAFR